MKWKRQGEALLAPVKLTDGRAGSVVLVGARENPKGAALVFSGGTESDVETVPLTESLHLLSPVQIIEILCMQERVYGTSGLTPPAQFAE